MRSRGEPVTQNPMNFSRTLRQMHRQVRREPGAETIHLGEDKLFTVLADSRRRFVIERVADGSIDPPTCSRLAAAIAADETRMAPEHVPPERVRPVEDDLRAAQLPRLVDAGVVRWDGADDEVRPGHSIEATAALLRDIDRRLGDQSGYDESPFSVGGACVDGEPTSGSPNRGRHRQ